MTPDPSAFAEPCAITAGAFCLTHRASTTDPRSEECVAMTLHDEVDRLRAGIEAARDALAASSCMGGRCAGPGCYGCRDSTLALNIGDLLNPTEGDDHG